MSHGHTVQLVERHGLRIVLRRRLRPRAHVGSGGRRIGDGRVDLAGRGIPGELRHHLGDGARRLPQHRQDVHRGEHPGVGEPEVAEVVVSRVLSTENSVVAGHLALDEGMPDPGSDSGSTGLGDDLGHRCGRDDVVDDRGVSAGVPLPGYLTGGHQRRDGGWADRLAPLVHHKAAIGVSVEGQPEVGAVGEDRRLKITQVLRSQRVGLVVGERPVQLEVQRYDGQRQRGQPTLGAQHRRHSVTTHSVAGIDDHGQGPNLAEVDQPTQERRVVRKDVEFADDPLGSFARGRGGRGRGGRGRG